MRKKLNSNKKPFYPVSSPYISKKDIDSVNRALKRGWISSDGPEIKKFEENFSRFVGRKYSIAVSSGTAALEIAIKALNVKEDDEVLVESFLDGTEVSVGVITYNTTITALPITEIVSENDFFDYEAKYNGQSQEITPARISDAQRDEVQQIAIKIYKTLKLKGLTRAEFIFHNNEPHFLEVNTCPGLSEASIIPQQAAEAGISLKDLFSNVIAAAMH